MRPACSGRLMWELLSLLRGTWPHTATGLAGIPDEACVGGALGGTRTPNRRSLTRTSARWPSDRWNHGYPLGGAVTVEIKGREPLARTIEPSQLSGLPRLEVALGAPTLTRSRAPSVCLDLGRVFNRPTSVHLRGRHPTSSTQQGRSRWVRDRVAQTGVG